MPTSERDRTFRVLGLPPDAKLHDSVNILSTLFDKNGQKTEPAVHSLGLDPYKFGRTVSKVATVTFARTPEILCNGKDRWNFFLDDATITIDTHFLGFTPLNSVKDDEDHKIDFIAVSGLSSHPFGSWKERGGPFMWLRDALARNPQGARVLLYGYDTGLVHSESFQDIDDIGNNLSFGIRQIRSPQPVRGKPIVFIAHSLGGLVVKEVRQSLAIYQMASSDPVNFQSVYGLLFFGVPNRGIEISHWLPIVDNQPNENLIRNLAPGSIYLRNLQHKFCQVFGFHDSRVVSIYETMKSKTAKQESPGVWSLTGKTDILVPRDSAVDSCPPGPRHDELGFNQNHSDLPKFSSPHEHDYRSVDYFLDDFRRDAVRVIQARFGNEGMYSSPFNSFLSYEIYIEFMSGILLIVPGRKSPVVKSVDTVCCWWVALNSGSQSPSHEPFQLKVSFTLSCYFLFLTVRYCMLIFL
ncbi:hypothetical protein K432DRAFT_309928 [Lepidopterella palustris CBS 459.81]|uniref:DUF676 domain-containing protein n=1 Tax=Lepidopterella palustris CBS 459.81 TaxID=1314670 RepID=A0A8E2DZV8_9PEZI|nr:hypothetical protein K432DRAFT_309928 [Lepidopterella palustris CBS 459.81]